MDENTHHSFLNGLVDQALEVLGEHFDAIQFTGTFLDDDGMTYAMNRGRGNWYARIGATMEWLDTDAAQTTARAIGEVLPGQDDA